MRRTIRSQRGYDNYRVRLVEERLELRWRDVHCPLGCDPLREAGRCLCGTARAARVEGSNYAVAESGICFRVDERTSRTNTGFNSMGLRIGVGAGASLDMEEPPD